MTHALYSAVCSKSKHFSPDKGPDGTRKTLTGSLDCCVICLFNMHKIVASLPVSKYLSYPNSLGGRWKTDEEGKRDKI
jgi:hypothetical protein